MNASLLAVLNDAERQLVAETEQSRLAELDEDAAIELETRIRRTRNKYVGQYRRGASSAVPEHGGRGKARPENQRAALKAEAFEETLSRVSRRVATLARRAAADLRAERDRGGPGGEARPRARWAPPGPAASPELRRPAGPRGHRRASRGIRSCRSRPAVIETGEREAAGGDDGPGCPAPGEARQPVAPRGALDSVLWPVYKG